jgi:membrane protein implicated in regulation of membrane protease activity
MAWTWLILAIALIVLELFTYQFVSIWFAVGALITTLFTAIFSDLDIWWQVLIFVVSSLAFLFATRPLVRKLLAKRGRAHETNLELIIGKDAVVVEDIDNIKGFGAVKINGLVWSARSQNDEDIRAGEIVVIKKIEGNKTIVKKKGD